MKETFSTRTMAEVAIFAALGYVLDFVAGVYSKPLFINGGSIGIALVVVFVMAYRRGFLPALLVGLIMGLLDVADGFYSIADTWYRAFSQVALDYWIAYPLAAAAGLFKKSFDNAPDTKHRVFAIVCGCLLGGFLKFGAHYLSGILFWPSDLWNVGGPYIFSLLYNGAYMLPCIILSGAVVVFIAVRYPDFLLEPEKFTLRHPIHKGDNKNEK